MNSSANHFPTKWSKKEEEIESSIDFTILIIVVVLVVLVLLIIVILILYWFCYRGKQRNRKISDTGKVRVRSRFFDQVGHETKYASSGNKHLSTK